MKEGEIKCDCCGIKIAITPADVVKHKHIIETVPTVENDSNYDSYYTTKTKKTFYVKCPFCQNKIILREILNNKPKK